ncbi:MAG: hypothetical protein ACR2OY_12570 [Boseongicola sp.]
MKFISFAAAAAALLLSTTAGIGQPFEEKGNSGGWTIFANKKTNGCFMERVTEQGIVLQIGSVLAMTQQGGAEDYGYFGMYIPGEAPEVTNDQPLVLVRLGQNTYLGQAQRDVREGYWGGYVVSDGENDLSFDLQNRKKMQIITQNGGLAEIDLTQSNISRGVDEVKKCQREMN